MQQDASHSLSRYVIRDCLSKIVSIKLCFTFEAEVPLGGTILLSHPWEGAAAAGMNGEDR